MRKRLGLALLALLLFTRAASGAGGEADRIRFDDYLAMDDAKKEAVAKKWVKLDGGYYVLDRGKYVTHTDISPEYSLKMTVLMDDFQTTFSQIFQGPNKLKGRPLLYVLSSQSAYGTALGEFQVSPGWSVGMFVHQGSKTGLFAYRYGDEEKLFHTLFHEGTHQLLHFFAGRGVPVWFHEGMATNLETFELHRNPTNNRANSIYKSYRTNILAKVYPDKGFVKFARLKQVDGFEWNATPNPGPNYASAWATCNFLLGCADGQKLMNILVRGYREGKKDDTILSSALTARIEEKMEEYVRLRILPNLKYGRSVMEMAETGKDADAAARAAEMLAEFPDAPEARFLNAWLSIRTGKTEETHFATLKEMDKDGYFEHPEMSLALAEGSRQAGELEKAVQYATRAVAENSKSERAAAFLALATGERNAEKTAKKK